MELLLKVAEMVGIALAPVFMSLLALLAKKLNDYIVAKINNEKLETILTNLTDGAFKVVMEVEQTFISNLDPNSPKDSAEKAKKMAMESLKAWIGPKGLLELKKILGLDDDGVEKLLSSHIETQVLLRKSESNSTVLNQIKNREE